VQNFVDGAGGAAARLFTPVDEPAAAGACERADVEKPRKFI
jgi:hypothetical protein